MNENNIQEVLDFISNLPKKKQIEYLNKQVAQVNRQMSRIEKSGLYSASYERAQVYLGQRKKRFQKIDPEKRVTNKRLYNTLKEVINFKKSPSYYLKDIRQMQKETRQRFEEMGHTFKNANDFNNFYKVIHSKEYSRNKDNRGRFDSGLAFDEIEEAMLSGATAEDIKKALDEMSRKELTLDEFQSLVNQKRGIKLK